MYFDESGFEPTTECNDGWAVHGKKVYRERSGNNRPRTSLIAIKRGKQILAPFLFEGCTKTQSGPTIGLKITFLKNYNQYYYGQCNFP